jgi:hypothetical protein
MAGAGTMYALIGPCHLSQHTGEYGMASGHDRHQALIDVASCPGEAPVPWFGTKVKCAKCGARGRRIDVRPNWKEASPVQDWRGNDAMPGDR